MLVFDGSQLGRNLPHLPSVLCTAREHGDEHDQLRRSIIQRVAVLGHGGERRVSRCIFFTIQFMPGSADLGRGDL